MAKHFEHLWEEAEGVADKFYVDSSSANDIENAVGILDNFTELTNEDKEEALGQAIFGLCLISKRLNLDAYSALRIIIDNAKQDMLDELLDKSMSE